VKDVSFTPPWVEIPDPGSGYAARPRIDAALRTAVDRAAVVTVTAGAGSGKTTALAAWARTTDGPVAWVNAAASPVAGGLWRAIRESVEHADRRPPRTAATSPYTNGPQWLAARARAGHGRLTLVIDDLHEIRGPVALASLDRLLAIVPEELRLVLASRWDPPLRLERLAAAGRVVDVRAPDLAMDRLEIAAVLAQHGAPLAGELLDRAVELTGGWPVAVGLVATAIGQGRDPDDVLAALETTDGDVASYLANEVLGQLPRRWRELLVPVSAVERVNGPLAIALTGDPGAGATLAEISGRTGLLTPVGRAGGWSELHALARAFLRARLRAEGDGLEARTEARAALWFTAQRRQAEALSHALRSGDAGVLDEVVTAIGLAPLLRSDGAEVAHLVAETDVARWSPGRGLSLAVAVLATAEPLVAARAATLLRWTTPRDATHALLHAVALARVARNQARTDDARALLASVPLAELGSEERLLVEHEQLQAELGTPGAAQLERRAAELLGVAETLAADRLAMSLHVGLSGFALVRGEPTVARAHAETALGIARRFGRDAALERSTASITGAVAAIELGDLEAAEHTSRPWLAELTPGLPPQLELAAVTAEVHVGARRGEPARGLLARLDQVLPRASTATIDPAVLYHASTVELRLAEATQDLPRAEAAARRMTSAYPTLAETAVVRADLLRLRRSYDAARRELRPILRGDVPYVMPATELSARCLDVVVAAGSGAPDVERLREVVKLAAATQRPGPLLDRGAAMLAVLVAAGSSVPDPDGLVSRIVTELRERTPRTAAHPLTSAELRVLEQLGSLTTLGEVAAGLHLSRNTVKTHVAAIYRKLGVTTRRDAVASARSNGLL
jgi:LuxR family transcriptional regulator, maltose regulon positive regulatory protein